jgi:tetratricopeptide (TPR) repeat protein
MTRVKRRHRRDPIDHAMELALQLGDFVDYGAAWSFVTGLEEVEGQIEKFLHHKPEHAIDLYETFIAGCYEKADEIDDSSGIFGMFVEDLFCGWITARQAASADAEKTAERLLNWMDKDDYGFCYQLEREAVKVLTKKGLSPFAIQVRSRFDAAGRSSIPPKGNQDTRQNTSYRRRYWGGVLKTIHAAQREVDAYVSLCKETELLPIDCEIVAGMLQSRRKTDQALEWVERGLDIEKQNPGSQGSSYKLADMKRTLLAKLGHTGEALTSAWTEFEKYPCKLAYGQLMKYVPKEERTAWHDRAMNASANADLDFVIELWLATREIDRLVVRLRTASHQELESLSHYTTEPVAKKLVRLHPDIAAKIYRALGMRILNAKKSKYYDSALSHFEQARRCYKKAGVDLAWEELVEEIQQTHYRKSAFMPGFEQLIQGKKPNAKSSFLDRTKRRKRSWAQRK